MAKRRKRRTADPDRIQDEGWPSRRLKTWPLPVDWTPSKQKKRISAIGYQKVVGAVRAMFTDDAMAETLVDLQAYCFQQGRGESNANQRDRVFFFDVLAHDLVFFAGDRARPIIEDIPLDPKVYDALPHMKSSHYDIYRLEKRGLLGGAKLRSELRPELDLIKSGVRPLKGPKKGTLVLGRVVQIGRSTFLDDPLFPVEESWLESIRDAFEEELEATRKRQPGLTRESLLKAAGYHLYELVAAHALAAELEDALPDSVELEPVIARYRVRKARQMPDFGAFFESWAGARAAAPDAGGSSSTYLVDLAPDAGVHRTVREAMVDIEGREVVIVAFIEPGATELIEEIGDQLPDTAASRIEPLTRAGFYRSLRHTLQRVGS